MQHPALAAPGPSAAPIFAGPRPPLQPPPPQPSSFPPVPPATSELSLEGKVTPFQSFPIPMWGVEYSRSPRVLSSEL
eukprot:5643914-Alexandrium_andersonii.AAC.1